MSKRELMMTRIRAALQRKEIRHRFIFARYIFYYRLLARAREPVVRLVLKNSFRIVEKSFAVLFRPTGKDRVRLSFARKAN